MKRLCAFVLCIALLCACLPGLAADQGNAAAQYNLGIIFQYGKGVIENSGKAKYYYQLAAEQGNEDAAKALKALSGK